MLDFGVGPAVSAAPVLEPYPGQTGVPPTFTGSEIPDPAPSAHYPLGYPITVTFGAADGFTLGSARLLNHQGTALPLVVDRPGQVDLAQNEVALLPRAPLQPGTTYQVQVRGFLDGRAWSRSWSFTTAL